MAGLAFAKAMPFIGSKAAAGFGAGIPATRRQVLLTAWRDQGDFEAFLDHRLGADLAATGRPSWWALFEIASTRGSHYGAKPLAPTEAQGGPFGALTLGRTRPRDLVRFLREGARLGSFVRSAQGLVTGYSAGIPLTGNCTVSIWESEQAMVQFAYRDAAGHGQTLRRDPPILREQLNARMRLLSLGGDCGHGSLYPDNLIRLARTLH